MRVGAEEGAEGGSVRESGRDHKYYIVSSWVRISGANTEKNCKIKKIRKIYIYIYLYNETVQKNDMFSEF